MNQTFQPLEVLHYDYELNFVSPLNFSFWSAMQDTFSSYYIGLLFLLVTFQSCGKTLTTKTLSAPEVTQAETVLLSELHSLSHHSVKCPLEIENLSSTTQQIRLTGTGCSCYGVNLNGKKLQRGESIELTADSSTLLEIEAQAPGTESLKKYRASFEFPSAGEPEIRTLFCELRVYKDIKVFPKVLICDTELGATIRAEKEITIERIFRAETGDCPAPSITNLPKEASIKSLKQTQESVQLEENVWKAIWTATLKIPVDGNLSAAGVTSSYAVAFPRTESEKPIASTSKIIRRVRVPVHFPNNIHFGRVTLGEKRKRSLFLSSVNGDAFRLNIESNHLPENLNVALPAELAPRYRIDLLMDAKQLGVWSHQLLLTTDLEKQPEIKIDLHATIIPPGE